jgi:TonB family protein
MPRLLNREEMLRNIHRFYPEEERRAGREGQVVARLRLTREGAVSGVDIESSAGASFDEAARKVLSLARFSPARAGDRAVAIKIRQSVDFRLAD